MASRSACSRAGATPMRASRTRRGALPGRNPGMRTSRAILRNAASMSRSNSASSTSTDSLTSVRPSFPSRGVRPCSSSGDGSVPVPSATWRSGRAPVARRFARPIGGGCGPAPRVRHRWRPYADVEAARPRQAPSRSARPRPGRHGRRPRSTCPGVPAGTTGKVILANGFNWLRYRVRVRQRRRAGRPRRPPPRADRPGGPSPGQAGQAGRAGRQGPLARPRSSRRQAG